MAKEQSSKGESTEGKALIYLGRAAWVVAIEAMAVALFAFFLLYGLITGQARSLAGEALLVVLFGAAAGWVGYIAISLRRGKRWARSAAVFWQTCQLFLASQSFTGRGANYAIGIALIATSVFVLGSLFSKPVLAESKKEIDSER